MAARWPGPVPPRTTPELLRFPMSTPLVRRLPRRFTWLAAKREPWTPQRHRQWPPRFQEAVQHLLLLHHFGRAAAAADGGGPLTRAKRARLDGPQCRAPAAAAAGAAGRKLARKAGGAPVRRGLQGGGGAVGQQQRPQERAALTTLPHELLLRIISDAAYPISSWA